MLFEIHQIFLFLLSLSVSLYLNTLATCPREKFYFFSNGTTTSMLRHKKSFLFNFFDIDEDFNDIKIFLAICQLAVTFNDGTCLFLQYTFALFDAHNTIFFTFLLLSWIAKRALTFQYVLYNPFFAWTFNINTWRWN